MLADIGRLRREFAEASEPGFENRHTVVGDRNWRGMSQCRSAPPPCARREDSTDGAKTGFWDLFKPAGPPLPALCPNFGEGDLFVFLTETEFKRLRQLPPEADAEVQG